MCNDIFVGGAVDHIYNGLNVLLFCAFALWMSTGILL